MNLFLTGHSYYTSIIEKDYSQQKRRWYETLYVYYYENFKTIMLVLFCICIWSYLYAGMCTCSMQQTKQYLMRRKILHGGLISAKARVNMEATKQALSSPFKKETYTKMGSAIKSGVSSGYERGKELGKEGLAYGVNQVREQSEFIYKYIALVFIGIGFSVYIFPVLAMFLIGAVTFLIVRRSIAGVITM